MTLQMFLMWVAVGLITGWLAGYILKEGGYGPIGDISLGILGSSVASGLFLFLVSPGAGVVVSLVVAIIGAAALIFAQHEFWAVPA